MIKWLSNCSLTFLIITAVCLLYSGIMIPIVKDDVINYTQHSIRVIESTYENYQEHRRAELKKQHRKAAEFEVRKKIEEKRIEKKRIFVEGIDEWKNPKAFSKEEAKRLSYYRYCLGCPL